MSLSKCFACNLSTEGAWIECSQCTSWYHFKCCGLEGLEEAAAENLNDWKCLLCFKHTTKMLKVFVDKFCKNNCSSTELGNCSSQNNVLEKPVEKNIQVNEQITIDIPNSSEKSYAEAVKTNSSTKSFIETRDTNDCSKPDTPSNTK